MLLIIDDEPMIRESFRLYLEDRGYDIITACDGDEGIEKYRTCHPDLVMVDLRMPRVGGMEVLQAIRANDRETPVIVISGTGAASDVVNALQAGATTFLTKPLPSLQMLKEKVYDSLERTRLIEENRQHQKGLETTIAELKTMQKQLVESEKMAALGSLVAGVAHEINTPLGIGVTAASHLGEKINDFKDKYAAGDASHDDLKKFLSTIDESTRMIEANLSRAAQLIRSFKQVAVDQSSESPRKFNLGEYMEDILLSLKPRLKKTNYKISLSCPPDLVIYSFPGALSRIMTNMIMNAIIHGFENRPDGTIAIQISAAGSNISIECHDNGVGMAATVVENVFEPFFTTKRGRGGSGLGMHMVFNLVTQTLSGSIECKSDPGHGTRFSILFPRQQEVQQ
ncbi:MAG: hybrid sensor histidine kinase/response regulator [Deltaproteobacteria bacterium]|nr:hybrid sensor histidine kinase/response regulator [Deltaproteobacteria bacterium]